MNPTMFEIGVAIFMVTGSVAIVAWFLRYLKAASGARMMHMMTRLGLDPGMATRGDPRIEAIIKEVQSRCRRCSAEDLCDRWMAGKAEGDNTFCPNAPIFDILTRATERTG